MRESASQMLRLTENERKIAMPPSRGRGTSWICRPLGGNETHPLWVARFRTNRVATNEIASEKANKAKNRTGKIRFPSG
jgi:hypothetical protein